MAGELQGKTALVTGASRGIGLAIAQELATAGADVVMNSLTGFTPDQINRIAREIPVLFPVHPRTRSRLENLPRRPRGETAIEVSFMLDAWVNVFPSGDGERDDAKACGRLDRLSERHDAAAIAYLPEEIVSSPLSPWR